MWSIVARNLAYLILGFAALFAMTSESPVVVVFAGLAFLVVLTAVVLGSAAGPDGSRGRLY